MAKAKKVRKRVKKNIPTGVAHVEATFNITIVTITDVAGRLRPHEKSASRVPASPRRSRH